MLVGEIVWARKEIIGLNQLGADQSIRILIKTTEVVGQWRQHKHHLGLQRDENDNQTYENQKNENGIENICHFTPVAHFTSLPIEHLQQKKEELRNKNENWS